MKKIIYTFLMLCVFTSVKAGDNKTVTLITSGQGKTQDEAKQNALRNAIEQAFGAFISSHTEVVNDNLVKDEIISVSNGNIQKYEIISESVLPDNLGYTTTLKTIVSISKLTSFCESKGMQIEVKGSLFAFNVIQKELSASNEKKALEELVFMAKNIAPKMFDYTITANEPIKNELTNNNRNSKNIKPYCLPIKVNILINKNWEAYCKMLVKTLSGLAISKSEVEDYKKLNISYYTFDVFTNNKMYNGNYKFYGGPIVNDDSQRKITQQVYDEVVWKELRIEHSGSSLNSDYRNTYPIIASGFDNGNYEINTLHFRTNIKSTLYSIYQIINNEAFNYKTQSQSGNEINSNSFKVLFSPMADEGGRRYYNNGGQSWESSDIKCITYKYKDFQKRADMYAPPRYVSVLNQKSIILQQIKSGTIIGYGYCSPLFDLEEIKNLSKLEVKHKD
jgi:hypothetical protein